MNWQSNIKDCKIVHDREHKLLYIKLTGNLLPNGYNIRDSKYSKLISLKNCKYRGIWRISHVNGTDEIFCKITDIEGKCKLFSYGYDRYDMTR
jgi:hypothetical protein